MHLSQDPDHNNVNILNNVRHSASRHYMKKKREYLIAKICELETDSMINSIRDLYRGISDFNPLNAELNPICHFLALLGAHHILHVGRIRVS